MYSPLLKYSSFILLGPVQCHKLLFHFLQDDETIFHWCTSFQHTSDTLSDNFLMYCCSSFNIVASFPKYTKEFHKYPLTSHKLNILMSNLAFLFGIYCLNLSQPFQSNSSSAIDRFLSGAYANLNFPSKYSTNGRTL